MSKYIITGGPCSGKTTLIEALSEHHTIYPESAREVIKQQQQLGTDLVPWLNLSGFSDLVAKHIAEKHKQHTMEEIAFCDRGIYDVAAYLRAGEKPVTKELNLLFQSVDYQKTVFICAPWEKIYHTDNERKETFEEGFHLYNHLRQTYQDYGFQLIEVPQVSCAERVNFVLDSVRNQQVASQKY